MKRSEVKDAGKTCSVYELNFWGLKKNSVKILFCPLLPDIRKIIGFLNV